MKEERVYTMQNEPRLRRSETEREFQETKLKQSEKHSETNSDTERSDIDGKFGCGSCESLNSFQNHYNSSFRTFGQKRSREEPKKVQAFPAETRYYQQALEYDDSDTVHY